MTEGTGFSDRFRHWLPPSESDTIAAITQGMVVLDTNVLLDMYRFGARARNELFEAFDKLGDRLWIPHQVAYEFHKNRVSVLMKHGAAYSDLLEATKEAREQVSGTLTNKIRHFSNRIALTTEEADEIAALVVGGLDQAIVRITDLHKQHGLSSNPRHDDPILLRLDNILTGRVGPEPSEEEDIADRAEAARRIDEKIPPGHEDRRKEDPHGDYLLWRQCLRETVQRKVPLVIVTRDSKEDWFWRESGQRIGARWELVRECANDAGVPFILMTTDTFLYHAAKTLKATVSEDTIRQVVETQTSEAKANVGPQPSSLEQAIKKAAHATGEAQRQREIAAALAAELYNRMHAMRRVLNHEADPSTNSEARENLSVLTNRYREAQRNTEVVDTFYMQALRELEDLQRMAGKKETPGRFFQMKSEDEKSADDLEDTSTDFRSAP